MRRKADDAFENFPRVIWWSVEPLEILTEYRDKLIDTVISLGLDSSNLRPTYYPHITVGSNGPDIPGKDWRLWDTHEIRKYPSIKDISSQPSVIPEKLHVTSIPMQPNSLECIIDLHD